MKSKFKKLMAAALVLCLMLALLPAGVLADDLGITVTYKDFKQNETNYGSTGSVIIEKTEENSFKLTATPSDGYGLKRIKVVVNSEAQVDTAPYSQTAVEYNFTAGVGANVTVYAAFLELYTVNTSGITGGTVTATPTTAFEGDLITLDVTAAEGYEYVAGSLKVTDSAGADVEVTGNTFTMPASNVTVGAEFKKIETPPPVDPTYTVTASGNYGGSVWVDKPTGLSYGETVTVNVEPYDGYWLESLTVGGVDVTDQVSWDWYWYYGRTGTYSFTVTGNTSVVATFATRYDDDIACIYDGRYGNVSLNVWSQALDKFVPYTSASKGDLVQVIVEPYNGYVMNSLSISERGYWGSSVDYWQSWKHDNVYYFNMPDSDVNIYVDFTEAASEHIVYVDTAKNGTLKADTTWAAYGQKVYVTATPDKGYELSSLFVKTARGEQLKVYEAKKADTYYFYMPDEYVTVSAWFAPEASALPFADVSYTNWYYDAVKFVYDKGIMDGVSYYRFAPDATITRGMVVTMLWRMAGEPYESSAGFTDVASGRYYSTAVAWAAKNGIVEGMTSSTFAPDQAITREQLASILYRYARWLGFSGYGSDISGYTDAGKVSGYAYDAMCWAVKTGVVTGTSAKVLDPQGTATRAAAAQMFMNFYNYIY